MTAFLRRLWAFVRPYRFRFILGMVCGTFYGLSNGALAAVVKTVVDLVFTGATDLHTKLEKAPAALRPLTDRLAAWLPELHAPSSMAGWLLVVSLIPALMLLRVVLAYLSIYLTNWSALRAIADIRTKLFDHLQNLSLGFFSRASTGDLISRIINDTQILYGIIGSSLASLAKDPVTILAVLIYQLTLQPVLTLASVVVLPVCLAPIIIYGRKVRKSAGAMQAHISDLTAMMHESFTGNRIIKAYNLEARVLAQFKETTRKYVGQVMRVLRANEIPSQLMEFLGAVGVALVFVYVLRMPKAQQPSVGDFTAFVVGIMLMYAPIKNLTRLHNQLEQARAASHRVFELLEMQSPVLDPPQPLPLKADHADIRFEDVDFDYGEKPVLRGINLTVKAGQLVALAGSSGAGKTTITNLLLRFYDPQRGAVRIGATDIRAVALKDLRRQIALVTQETILFHDTIRRNIAVGRPEAPDAEIEAAARHANAHEFILEKPRGYETVVGEKGVMLSGGQRQRIAIARAILKDAPILVLDEATSALDTESERAVQAALERLMQGRTTICIAHRLSTIQRADVIVVLDSGRIAEMGRHAELIQRGGIYQKLYELQFRE
jgi:subfamily B ATP-binding cassette protein MsbA